MRIQEAATLRVDPTTKALRVCLIREGSGSSADYLAEFFNQTNADALAGVLSFPNHPFDLDKPQHRDPLSAIGIIGEKVVVETDPATGKKALWSDYEVPDQKVKEYLTKFGHKLGLSIYADSIGHKDPSTGKWIAESIRADDPYRSVDLVVAPGAGGKFDRIAEGFIKVVEASAIAGENKEFDMEPKDVKEIVDAAIAPVLKVVEGLTTALSDKAAANAQIEADKAAVDKTVAEFAENYDKAMAAVKAAQITESQEKSLRALVLKGEDITQPLAEAVAVVAEARKGLSEAEGDDTDTGGQRIVESHGSSTDNSKKPALDLSVGAGFGEV